MAIENAMNLNINIAEQGGFYNLVEITEELEGLLSRFSTQAMNNHTLFLQGKREMLVEILSYLDKIQN